MLRCYAKDDLLKQGTLKNIGWQFARSEVLAAPRPERMPESLCPGRLELWLCFQSTMNFNRECIVPHRFTNLVSTQGSQLRNHTKLLEFRGTLLGRCRLGPCRSGPKQSHPSCREPARSKRRLRKTPQPVFRILVG